MSDEHLQARIEAAVKNPRNLGEMENADAVGTVGSPDCGDMLRMWIKFKEEDGRKIIDRATFQPELAEVRPREHGPRRREQFGSVRPPVAAVRHERPTSRTAASSSTRSWP